MGLTLPGMIELPGSLAGMIISPIPHLGPEAKNRMSLAMTIATDLIKLFINNNNETATSLNYPNLISLFKIIFLLGCYIK